MVERVSREYRRSEAEGCGDWMTPSALLFAAVLWAGTSGCQPSDPPVEDPPPRLVVLEAEPPKLTPRKETKADPGFEKGTEAGHKVGEKIVEPVRTSPEGSVPGSALLPDFASVYEKVVPGVVVIRVYRAAQTPAAPDGLGSGFFVGHEGRILTNEHVIAGGGRIEIETFDGRTAEATLVGSDPAMDLAVLEVALDPMVVGLPVAGEDSVVPGSWVMAVGNPLGLEFSATRGVISSAERGGGQWNRLGPWDFLQTDAAINRGNSGGPLVDLDGRVVGICTAMDGEADRISFAIPMALAVRVQEHLERYGEIRRGWLGIELEREQGGVVVKGVVPDSPAERAGIRPGDRVVAVDGQWAGSDLGRVRFELSVSEANRPVVLVLERQGRRLELEVDLEPIPEGSVARGGLT